MNLTRPLRTQWPVLLALAMLSLFLIGCGEEPAEAPPEETAAAPASEEPAAEEAAPPEVAEGESAAAPAPTRRALMDPAALNEQAPEKFAVRFDTSRGVFRVEVTRTWAPRGADRFYNLVKNGFYDDCRFFRVVPGFVVQFGMNGDPAVQGMWMEQRIDDDPVTRSNRVGTVTFATSGANSRTTQLFINLGANQGLDGQGFAPFGEVAEGMDVVQSIYSGYGQTPEQSMIAAQGNAYLNRQFPNLDYIRTAKVE